MDVNKEKELENHGAKVADDVKDIFKFSDLVITCLPGGNFVEDLYFGKNNNIFWRNAIRLAMMLTAINVKDGAKTSIHLACSDEVKDITGKFFANSQVKKGSSKAKNDEHNVKLWELSEEFVKPFL